MITIRYTCSDSICAMVRDYVTLSFDSRDEAFTDETWTRVKRIFARRNKTKVAFVSITATEQMEGRK